MDKVFIVKDVVIEEVKTKRPYYEVVTFENDKPSIASVGEAGLIQMYQITENVDIHEFVLGNKLFQFGMTKKAEEKLPVLSLINILIDEKDFLNQQLKKLDKKVIDLTWRLANYENSKIIRFLHFIKIL